MSLPSQPRHCFLLGLGGAVLLSLPCSAPGQHGPRHAAPSAWQQALHTREAFEASADKSRATFAPVLDAFRAVYHENPRDLHAPQAVEAVAELLAEQGRALDDERSFRSALGQYEFLRQQYPTSSLRWGALLAEARIEDADLHDSKAAHERYAELLHDAPRSTAAGEARVALAEDARSAHATPLGTQAQLVNSRNEAAPAKTRERASPIETPVAEILDARSGQPAPELSTIEELTPIISTRSPLAAVTGIRHWSTPNYTRVAIDLGGEVAFQAARVPHPDRIYFDLHGARLGAALVGKSFAVEDDGFLKRIRAAQESPQVTRVVLDVSDVADYSAFLLPNPYRLIIDIHGARPANRTLATAARPEPLAEAAVAPAANVQASAAADASGFPAMSPTNAEEIERPSTDAHRRSPPASRPVGSQPGRVNSSPPPFAHPANQPAARSEPKPVDEDAPVPLTALTARPTPSRPVPNTVETRSPAASAEVAEVSLAPGKEEATAHPTSKPISSAPSPHGRHVRHQPTAVQDDAAPARAAARTADGETSLVRALGLGIGRIVIDPGHGGHDSGTIGVDGIEEKDVVLDVALRLGQLLHDRLGAEIIYTRSDDTFIPLETRTAIADKAQADLFLSIHANSSSDPTARGVETYYLNFTSDPSALDVAARENAVSGQSIHELSSLVKKIALKDKIDESREFATDVESSLYKGLERGNAGLKNRGVKKAPFVVLIGANMPSILAEISFVTNPRDSSELRQPEYRQRVAESLFRGVEKYEQSLAGIQHPAPPLARAAIR